MLAAYGDREDFRGKMHYYLTATARGSDCIILADRLPGMLGDDAFIFDYDTQAPG